MSVGERRNGNLLVQLDGKLQAQPVELLRQRLSPDGHSEYLIRWALQNAEEGAGSGGSSSHTDNKSPNILMWMSAEEVYRNCPSLLGKRKAEGPGAAEEKTSDSPDQGALQEMTEDVRMLVHRATRQMSQSSAPDSSILNTIHVLSAYASIASLAGVFKETGALDLLMKMLCNPEKQIRKNAGKMLRALASHDAGSRAHVLLSLSQQDGIEQHMDFESRYTLLQLFAETTSSEEHCISFEGIHLPQIPGKQLFSLVKRYLCVTSLLDQLNSERPDGNDTSRLQRHFHFSMAMGSLICELVRVMGWVSEEQDTGSSPGVTRDYVEYQKQVLLPGGFTCVGGGASEDSGAILRDDWWEIVFLVQQMEGVAQEKAMEMIGGRSEKDALPLPQVSVTVSVAQHILAFIEKNCNDLLLRDLQASHVYKKFYGRATRHHSAGDTAPPTDPAPNVSHVGEGGSSDLQLLNSLLLLEGLEVCEKGEEKVEGRTVDHDTRIERFLESCRLLAPAVRHVALDCDWESPERNVVPEEARVSSGTSALSEKMVAMLVELLTSQAKDKMLVVTCLQLTYLIMSKYDWRVLFATEGGVRAVLGCMQEHHSSAAVQHMGLVVLKVLTGVDGCDLQVPFRCNNLNPGDAQVIKEIFSSIGSAASGTSTSLLRAIPGAIAKMISVEGCFSSVFNGLLVVRMLMEDHKGLSEQLASLELSSVLKSCSEDSVNSIYGRLDFLIQKQLSDFLKNSKESAGADSKEGPPGPAVQDMDLPSLLSHMKDSRTCRDLLPSLERCVCDDVSSLRSDLPQLLTDTNFFLQLLTCLEQLRGDKCLQLSVFRILNKALHLYEEDVLPWHKSLPPSLTILRASAGDRELFQEVSHFLHSLATLSKDCALLMWSLQTGDIVSNVLDRPPTSDLRDLLTPYETYAHVHHKMAAYVVAGCMQTVLSQIDEHRLHCQKLSIPLLDVFLRSLAGACTRSGEKEDKCWEKMEVSSNPHRANKLSDGNPKSYWESSGSTGSHYINISIHRGVVIRQLVMVVASEDSSYMPARVVVMGGENLSNINTELNAVNISSSAGRVLLLENVTRFWPVIQIKIKRCQQGGIDTRVRGLEILGPKPTFWPVFKEQLCRRTFLFYTSRAHSWGQEIRDKKDNLLHLFSRLNRALSHEQEFAERFLPDDEAAQALGRTCWEALISPLVQSITSSDVGGASPLGWLLTRYLENGQGSRRPKLRLSVFNSRVRKLTHLLVHVDSASSDTSLLKPPSKTSGKNRSSTSVAVSTSSWGMGSMAGMAQCWQGVVQQQVQGFLESSWKDVDVVPGFCSMYVALRRAMEEMFGQQTRFLLALQQGFCQGLLHLSFLSALHVMEQFARYIDRRIIAIRSDSSDFRSLEQLQQFLEFVLFLSDLELSNSFEHFYRHYLADRLLTLGACWLEDSVVDHIGICFPNRFPQQMLKNLQEAKDLQREEHLYRLQQLDNGVLSEEEEEGMEDSEDGSEVEVLVLSVPCWPISTSCFLDNPEKYFCRSLIYRLMTFSNFFSKCPSRPGVSHINQSRRLQWTWLGNSEVQYGRLTLRVSTLQMFILLQFNHQEHVSEEEFGERMGVSDGLLRNSLEPLTGKTGILAIREDSGCLYVKPSCDRPGTAVTLSPTWGPRGPDISSLEGKRRDILALLDGVMREERYIHIDRLVAKVICASQKGSAPPPCHGCSPTPTDVLSCVMSQIRGGAIYRKTNSPLILSRREETPPPSPPHPQNHVPIPPQVSEFCSVRKITNNIGSAPEERPAFRTFRYPD